MKYLIIAILLCSCGNSSKDYQEVQLKIKYKDVKVEEVYSSFWDQVEKLTIDSVEYIIVRTSHGAGVIKHKDLRQ